MKPAKKKPVKKSIKKKSRAVAPKKKTTSKKSRCEKAKQNIPGYDPVVAVSTNRISTADGGKAVEISVRDNGNGIPDSIKDKIFQPFFTTKATGQGTGLGLSLSYDIIKAHGGTITVNSKAGEGAEFIIKLPLK